MRSAKYMLLFIFIMLLYGCTAESENVPEKPFYEYYDENGQLKVQIFYNETTGIGSGIKYEESVDGIIELAFEVEGDETLEWEYPNPYSLLSIDGDSGELAVEEYEELFEYNDAGKITKFHSMGLRGSKDNPDVKETIVSVELEYRDDGTVKKRDYIHNGYLFGTTHMGRTGFYDEEERILYEDSYISHGSLEYFYIYEGDNGIPSYVLTLDNYGDMVFASLGKCEETWKNESDSSMWLEIPEDGENALLVQAGFGDAEIFFEKQYEKEKVVLYFDEKQNRGCGFLYTASDGESDSCLGFMFEGCEVIDGDDVEPYSVYYAYDLSGVERYEYALEEIPKEDVLECEYENELLQHISLYVTHGANERFYIYEEGKTEPEYCLTLDPGWGACLCRFE